jgi:NADH-quinone oxidoreductase subunit L
MEDLIWIIPALPLAGFVLLVAFGRRLGEPLAGWLATAVVGASFVASVGLFLSVRTDGGEHHVLQQTLFEWMPSGGFQVSFGFLADPLSVTMCLFVTGIAALIHLYSIGYMHGDPDFSKFFVYLNLFVFSMLMLVLGDNLLVTFLGWEGVGACSYLLISFWFTSEANASAGKKAFVTNRVGDCGFLLATFLAFATLGTIQYSGINAAAPTMATTTATAIAALLFVGAVGKSAQLPLSVWLPDAMAGPTPVSALIHAATMVTAGVYLMVRVNPVLAASSSWVPMTIAVIGALTALWAATIAIAQNDIKKVLAYSTISQLGYMFMAVGSGAYVAAIFHMVTHAFFKALLFLGAGSVIHGMHDEQDMRRMGALRKLMPITAVTFIIGWLAIAGIFPFAGFFSKDEILLADWAHGGNVAWKGIWAIGLFTALLTAFYMSRQVFMVFFGKAHWDGPIDEKAPALAAEREAAGITGGHGVGPNDAIHPHESPWLMTVPLVVLAILSFFGGWLNAPFSDRLKLLEHWLEPVVETSELQVTTGSAAKWTLAVVALALVIVGIGFAYSIYFRDRKAKVADRIEQPLFAHGWYYDWSITEFMGGPGRKAFDGIAWFDKHVVDGAVNGVAAVVRGTGREVRTTQTGFVRSYAMVLALGVVVIAGLLLSKAVW